MSMLSFIHTPTSVIVVAIGALAITVFAKWVQITRHPLYKYPGPWTARFSNFAHCRRFLGGRQPFEIHALHEKYGPIVRTAPNDLSFSTSQAWRDIYGARKGHLPFIKSEFYDGGNFAADSLSIVSERDPTKHAHMRKYLSNAFSDRSLKEQEYLVAEVVDEMIVKLGELADGKNGVVSGNSATNMVMWYNLVTFDIIGSLAFGESFGGVTSGEEHPWISTVIKSLRKGALGDCMKRFPAVAKLVMALLSKQIDQMLIETRKHEVNSRELVEKRIARQTTRRDFMSNILQARKEFDISDTQIAAHTSDFVIAGSETTATALACATYFLLRDPSKLVKLRAEIDSAFRDYQDINALSTGRLEYLTAVCKEAMRMYPPLPFALPRIVPKGGDTVDGQFLPAGTVVSSAPLASSLSSANFHDPWSFKPERWIEKTDDDLEASQPFSLGARGCMGRNMGWMEMRTIMTKVFWSFDMELVDDDLDWHRDSEMHTLWRKPELNVKVSRRRAR
ncbi:Isotrichodermin C-15 hydroxylase [Elsinoe australis]|uniref:Isotrichodermin C-15 hydroxylase n=1 Tax=Elsinoe australis TaxID=40998 RepID=A0A2P7YDE5_9PEZI|nr:Isotrichodermin C-15 hydroxylase [Elsinoe australis]